MAISRPRRPGCFASFAVEQQGGVDGVGGTAVVS
jgi:hypothetical protein